MNSNAVIHHCASARYPAKALLGLALLVIAASAGAQTWVAAQKGNNWVVKKGSTEVAMPDEKTARQTAGKLRKAEKGAEKRAGKSSSDFKEEQTGPCSKPSPNINC
ncbi:MAG: hypothetical protein H6934_05090 [Burkholderiaceae bacterium]|nr:hypothetical protein [Burkholderiaceae bacterium]